VDVIKPRVFFSYSRRDETFVRRVAADLGRGGLDCWIDTQRLEVGDKLENIRAAIRGCSLVFAYVTPAYLASRWCRDELRIALAAPGVAVAPYVDSADTLDALPGEIRDDVTCGILQDGDQYVGSIVAISGIAWSSLQTARRVVSSDDHILAGPAIFDSIGYRRVDLIERAQEELILAGANLRSWLTNEAGRKQLISLVEDRGVRVTMILATFKTLAPISPEGAVHLRSSVREIKEMMDLLSDDGRRLMTAHFHVGASTLSAVFVDPESPNGILFFNPRWAIQFLPQDRLTCVIEKSINSTDLYKALYNGVLLMIQGDARSLEDMLAES
jgi:hypothetical protein